MNKQSAHQGDHTMNEEAMNQSHASLREPFHESPHSHSLFPTSQPIQKQPFDSSLASGIGATTAASFVSIAVKRPGPEKKEEDVDDFFNALDSSSQMAVESQYSYQTKRMNERKKNEEEEEEENGLSRMAAMDEKEELDLMVAVDQMEMEIEEEKLRESQLSQAKTDASSQLSSQTHNNDTRRSSSQSSFVNTKAANPSSIQEKPASALNPLLSTEQRSFFSASRESSQSSSTGRSSNTVRLLDAESSAESPVLQRKGKRFVKHAVKKSSNIVSLTPYQPFSVCNKHSHKTTSTITTTTLPPPTNQPTNTPTSKPSLVYQKLLPNNGENDIGAALPYGSPYASYGLR